MSGITIKTPQDIEVICQGGKILADVLDNLVKASKIGITTEELDVMAEKLIRKAGGEPAFKGYRPRYDAAPFPTTICSCLNSEVVHAPAAPSRELKNGDLLKIDIGMKWQGLYTDMARTIIIGDVDKKTKQLVEVTEKALAIGIKQVRAGHRVSDISKAIEKYVEKNKFSIVRELVGHGVGYQLHEPPEVPNFWQEGFHDPELKQGMVIAIEPMINLGDSRVKVGNDGWTISTTDGKASAHFEHTVIVKKRGSIIATV